MRLDGKKAIITGGAAGFGRAMARRFSREGAWVGLLDINEAGANEVTLGLDSGGMAIKCDVSNSDEVREAVNKVIDEAGRVDIVVNNAGWSHRNQPLLDVTEGELRRVYEINVFSIFHMVHAIVPHWRKRGGGTMVNISSTAGHRPRPGLTWYNSTKGAVSLMTKSLAVELAPDGIRVCGIAPVIGNTDLLETFLGCPDTPENRKRFEASIPLGRFCDPEDVANAALYLASDEAEFITGSILQVDGGRCV